MRKWLILASVVVVAAGNAACANSSASDLVSPSALGDSSLAVSNGSGGGKGKNAPVATVQPVVVNDQNGDGLPNYGDSISFDVNTTATTDPHVNVTCSQNGTVVFGASWPITPEITLASQMWQGGAAACTADVFYINGAKAIDLGSSAFNVSQ